MIGCVYSVLWLNLFCTSVFPSSDFFFPFKIKIAKGLLIFSCRTSELDESEFIRFHSTVKRGDLVGISGFPGL